MKRFDRIVGVLLQLQARRVITAAALAERFGVSLRTVYRDIRSLENAGVPIAAEPGLGYFLTQGYNLPPITFSAEEAAALLIGDKFLQTHAQGATSEAHQNALAKVRAVLKAHDKGLVEDLDRSIEVFANGFRQRRGNPDPWLEDCQQALVRAGVLDVEYAGLARGESTRRQLEPIGVYHSRGNWHLVAWCRLRHDYRDFRLDRIRRLVLLTETFERNKRCSLQDYLNGQADADDLVPVTLGFPHRMAAWVDQSRYGCGFVGEARTDTEVRMDFLVPSLEHMAQWILTFGGHVTVHAPAALRTTLRRYIRTLAEAYGGPSGSTTAGSTGGRGCRCS